MVKESLYFLRNAIDRADRLLYGSMIGQLLISQNGMASPTKEEQKIPHVYDCFLIASYLKN